MATIYRANVLDGEAAANGDLHLDTWIQKSEDDGATWENVPAGHRTLVLDGAAVLTITESAGTDQQKRAALLELFRQEAESWGIDESDDAYTQMYDLLPSGWPVTVEL
jgi:hypothetical protein